MTAPALVVVQARSGSTRLPGKVLADLDGMPMLEFQLRRLLPVTTQADAKVVVATSDLAADEPIATIAGRLGIPVVRGSEDDVLGRFSIALVRHPADTVVRITGDSPLNDPFVVIAALELHRRSGADYTGNMLPRSYPRGLDVEVLSARSLRIAELEAQRPDEREHVTPYLYRRPERFRIANLHSGHDLAEERWTVDTAADLARMREIVSQVPDAQTASWNRILAVIGRSVKPRPGQVVLRPLDDTEPGASPWVRTWSIDVDGGPVGEAQVIVGEGKVERHVRAPDQWMEPAREALYRLLLGDHQTAP